MWCIYICVRGSEERERERGALTRRIGGGRKRSGLDHLLFVKYVHEYVYMYL